MARIRSIKPEFWLDEEIASWPPLSRLTYIALWNEADDEGRLRANPAYLKNRVFPYEPRLDIGAALDPIIRSGKLVVYLVGGQTYGFLPRFSDHQVINHPSRSRLPGPEEGSRIGHEDSGSTPVGFPEDSRNDPAGKEGKGREQGTGKGACNARARIIPMLAGFDDFWSAYPKKAGKADAVKAWGKLSPAERTKALEMVEVYAAAMTGREGYVKNAQGWLNSRRFEDDPASWRAAPRNGTPAPTPALVGAHPPTPKLRELDDSAPAWALETHRRLTAREPVSDEAAAALLSWRRGAPTAEPDLTPEEDRR